MPILSSGSNITLTVSAGQILTVQCEPAADYVFENPVGTRIGDYGCDSVFGPFTSAGSVKLTSNQGALFYELGAKQSFNSPFDPSNVDIRGGSIGGGAAVEHAASGSRGSHRGLAG